MLYVFFLLNIFFFELIFEMPMLKIGHTIIPESYYDSQTVFAVEAQYLSKIVWIVTGGKGFWFSGNIIYFKICFQSYVWHMHCLYWYRN